MVDEKMIKLQHFFTADIKIKKEIYDISPISFNKYLDENSLIKYTDKLNDTLIYVFSELKCIATDIFGNNSDVFKRICYLEQVTKNSFYNCGNNPKKLINFYKKFISNMELDFINRVKDECVGYSFGRKNAINLAVSINEVLHFIHSYVNNNENILQSMPLLNQKKNESDYPIILRGVKVPIFEQLFMMFPTNLDCGWTDMVAINERKLIMMVRDRGHALSIEISLNNDIARIEYFIPKLCNIDMINKLPGINKVKKDSIGATGVIEVEIQNLPFMLFDFISKVPMDSDIIFEEERFRKH